ncbi:MAG: non-hydrolyzing UDP-N-acetylglucosamine 2-epimerase [Promethearchaeota archaeon]
MSLAKFKLFIIMGTRPEIIKLSPVLRELKNQNFNYEIVFTDQHYDSVLSKNFFNELKLDKPKYYLKIGRENPASQTANAIIGIEKILKKHTPDLVLVQGDTNSSLAGALTAVKLSIKLGHIEAGLRSYDLRMPEEHNRRMIDHISNFLFAPTEDTVNTLKKENVWGKIVLTGNTIIDACKQNLEYALKKSKIMLEIPFKKFILVTTHRAENVDDPLILKQIIDSFLEIPFPIVFPMHPRTLNRLKKFNLYKLMQNSNILIMPPVGYFDFLNLIYHSYLIITDSGGIQEESTAPEIKKYTIVIRKTSDRIESCKTGFSIVVGTEKDQIVNEVLKFIKNPPELPNKSPFGDGNASKRIISFIKKEFKIE